LNNTFQSTCNNHNKGSLEIPSSVADNEIGSHDKLPFNSDVNEKFDNSKPINAIISYDHENSNSNSQDNVGLKITNNGQTNEFDNTDISVKSFENIIAEQINFLTRSSSKRRLKKRNKYKAEKFTKSHKSNSQKTKNTSSKSTVKKKKKQVIQKPNDKSKNVSNKTVVNAIDQIIINEMKRKTTLQSNLTRNRNSTMNKIQPNISKIIAVNKTNSQQRINNTTQKVQIARVKNAKNIVKKVVNNTNLEAAKRNITLNNKKLISSMNSSKLTTINTSLQNIKGANSQVIKFIDPKTQNILIVQKSSLPSVNILNKEKPNANNDKFISSLRNLQVKDHLKQRLELIFKFRRIRLIINYFRKIILCYKLKVFYLKVR
jgi:hypothetical protein